MNIDTAFMRQRRGDSDPVQQGPQDISFIAGYASSTACRVLVVSLTNTPASLYCAGIRYSINWTPFGTDHPASAFAQAFFYDHVLITKNLVPGARHRYYVESRGRVSEGEFSTIPDDGSSFYFYFITCDNNNGLSGGAFPASWYSTMRKQIEADPALCVGAWHLDDLFGYMDSAPIDDSDGVSGLVCSAGAGKGARQATIPNTFDYALSLAAALGLTGGGQSPHANWGGHPDRVWFYRHVNLLAMWGDHDAGDNEMGWDTDPATSAKYTAAKTVWDTLIKPLSPPSIPGAHSSHAWGAKIGNVDLIALDGITHASGDATDQANNFVDGSGPATVFSDQQIDDVLAYANSSTAEFKLFGLNYSYKYLSSPRSKNESGAQNPLKNLGQKVSGFNEIERLMTRPQTGSDPLSVMANPKLNGTTGCAMLLHGDHHWPCVTEHKAPAAGGNLNEDFTSVCAGTVGHSRVPPNRNAIRTGDTFDGSTVLYALDNSTIEGDNSYETAVRIDVGQDLRVRLFEGEHARVDKRLLVGSNRLVA